MLSYPVPGVTDPLVLSLIDYKIEAHKTMTVRATSVFLPTQSINPPQDKLAGPGL